MCSEADVAKCQKFKNLFCSSLYDTRPTSVSSAEINVQQHNKPLAILTVMMPSSAVGNILIKSQAHMNNAVKWLFMKVKS